jgi:hypothetical protein
VGVCGSFFDNIRCYILFLVGVAQGLNFQQLTFSHECRLPGFSRLQVQFEGTQQLLNRQNSFQGRQSLQSIRSLGLMQGVHPHQALQYPGASAQRTMFAGSANQFAHLQRAASSQASFMQIAPANQLSTYQVQIYVLIHEGSFI